LLAWLSEAVYEQDRLDEAARYADLSEEAAAEEDVLSQVVLLGTRAKVMAARGSPEEAEQVARKALLQARTTDSPTLQASALLNLAEVLRLEGRAAEAETLAEEAIDQCEAKGNIVLAEKAKSWLAELRRLDPRGATR
jgi:ATP/maltotriose-dependent transcriptional regulator MalT